MNVKHLDPLYDLHGTDLNNFVAALGSWFVSHETLPLERLVTLIDEVKANEFTPEWAPS